MKRYINNIENALNIAVKYGQTNGSFHKAWVIDQMVRALCGDDERYKQVIDTYESQEDSDYYGWNTGTAPNFFLEEFNKNKASDEFLDSCKKAGNLFNKKQTDAPNYKQYINDLIELLMRFENDVVCMELNHWKPDETNETWCSRNCGKDGTCPSKECYMEYLKMKECLRGVRIMEMNNEIFTNEHREYINKQITKALKKIDYEKIVRDAVEKEFDDLYEECRLQQDIKDMVTKVIYEHLVKSGLLKGEDNNG